MKKYIAVIIISFAIACTFQCAAQVSDSTAVVDSAKVAVARLCSREFAGRGYLKGGHNAAATYVRAELAQLKLARVMIQPFEFDIMVLPRPATLSINSHELVPGVDFLPYASTGTGKGVATDPKCRPAMQAPDYDAMPIVSVSDTAKGPGTAVSSRAVAPRPTTEMSTRQYEIFNEQLSAVSAANKSFSALEKSLPVRIASSAVGGAKLILVRTERLTHDIGMDSTPVPVMMVRASSMPDTVCEVAYNVTSELRHVKSNNVIAFIPGSTVPDSMVILCAHYDHLGMIGDSVYFPGANDNASGTAMLLAMARAIQRKPLRYTTVLVAFSGEEAGLIGSRYFSENPPVDMKRVRFVLNMDMTASGRDGIMACGGSDFPSDFQLLQTVNDSLKLGELKKRAGAPNSDQYFLVQHGVPGFYVYPYVGYQPYHSVNDAPETLQWDVFYKMYQLLSGFVRRL